ncbi:MAG TPA: (Fe-S)-binding protein, partial [Nitrospira sp.]|nr:(Fe-S)-binding protein [Nitrospira sp.]
KGGAFESFLRFLGNTQDMWDRPFFRKLLERITTPIMKALAPTARLPHDLVLPKLSPRHLRERYAYLIPDGTDSSPTRSVAYFHGCAADYFEDGVGDAVIEVLKKHGAEPALPPQRCSGTPIQTYGHVELVREGARFNLRSLAPYETVVTGCASCTLMLKDYPTLFPDGIERRQAEEVAKKVMHISEFVARSPQHPPMAKVDERTKRVTYHSSCHLRAAGVTKEPRQVLSSLPGVDFVEMQDADRCAGGAGTYMVKNYDTSQKIFERKARAITQTEANVVATSCPACMIQLKNGMHDSLQVKHVAQLLQEAYRAAEREPS